MIEFENNPNKKEIILKAKLGNLSSLLEVLDSELEKREASFKAQTQIDIAFEEMYVNICHYAYGIEDSDEECYVSFEFDNDDIIITLKDEGIPFNPLEKEDPDINASAEERNIGGLGIMMVKKTMDECFYERVNNTNIFKMRKRIK